MGTLRMLLYLSVHVAPCTRASLRRNLKYTLSLAGSMSRALRTMSYALKMDKNEVPSVAFADVEMISCSTCSSMHNYMSACSSDIL